MNIVLFTGQQMALETSAHLKHINDIFKLYGN